MCSIDVNVLQLQNIMNSTDTEVFELPRSVFQACLDSDQNPFQTFCLYPPNEGHMSTSMCAFPQNFDPNFLFEKMNDKSLTLLQQLPKVITYPRILENEDWVLTNIVPEITPFITLRELNVEYGYNQWFLGNSFSFDPIPPNITTFPTVLFTSLHAIFQLRATNPGAFNVFVVNPFAMITKPGRVTYLYNNGNIKVFENEASILLQPIWESATDDKDGDSTVFTILRLESIATNTIGSIASSNGRYILAVFNDSVQLLFNPFNAARYTLWTSFGAEERLKSAVEAQSKFCFQALNNPNIDPTYFVDSRCSCIGSERLLGRIYDPTGIESLPITTQERLKKNLPCILSACQLEPAEYTNAARFLKNTCLGPASVCSQYSNPGIKNLLITQQCGINTRPCNISADCPYGSSCVDKQCLNTCSTDAACQQGNPFAICVDGNCRVNSSKNNNAIPPSPPVKDQQQDDTLSIYWILVIIAAIIVFFLLILLVFYSVR